MSGAIAVLNAGSSSLKFALYDGEQPLYRGQVEQIGISPSLKVKDAAGEVVIARTFEDPGFDHRAATRAVVEASVQLLGGRPRAVGHRVVHGGAGFSAPVRINAEVIAALSALIPLAPLHQPHNLEPIVAIAEAAPELPQVACFDTAFHRNQPKLAQMFAIPRKFTEEGVRRYGFHGLSYEYVAALLPDFAPDLAIGRVIVAHLGNGASLCAIHAGGSVASTMGFTAVDGLMMGTRCGAIDPGVLIYLMDRHGMDARALEDMIYRRSGLLGVSSVSSDMRQLRASHEPEAAEAIALFAYRIVREIGSLAAAMGGLDGLIFTGGIGENDATLRSTIARDCRWLGLTLDEARNAAGQGRISADTSKVAAFVVHTDEERMMARHTAQVLAAELV